MPSLEDSFEFSSGVVGIFWKDSLRPFLKAAPERMHKAAIATSHSMAPQVESYMKLNAPWTDRTSNARNGLAARPYEDKDEIGIVLFHQVDYGIWLETRFGGRYAIIDPTIEVMGPQVMARYNRLLERM